ncbi:GNAT family N-acetyltransferase [Streptomyces sp. M2CJ-2]|uniref:GNAT family N-acetyltransferase n=1 Tax=Streptomyces sp. M2CJ-2 TaxID=2803948 RepID=UPI001925D556|nr:GNAT family N-acetyltransferase [Streptomyces sp. M2CJ-2]MBL3668507.1 GNAT family N-acetyltransferase [Streptomyces sp. M2CJ-2]
MSPLTARVLGPADRPTAADLPALDRPPVIWEDDRWWRFTERTDLHEARYLGVYGPGGDLVALAPLLVTRDGGGLLFYDVPKMVGDLGAFGDPERLPDGDRTRWDGLVTDLPDARRDQYPSLALSVFGSHLGLVHAADRTPAQRREVLAELPRLLDDAAEQLGCRSTGLLYATDEQAALIGPAAEARGHTPAVLGAESVLRLNAQDWDGYLAALTSRKRNRLRRELRDYHEAGFTTVIRHGADALTDSVVDLQVALRAKYGLPGGRARVQRDFDAIRETVGDSCMVVSAEREDETLGFVLYLRSGQALYARTAGFDADRARGVYFSLTYHETVRWSLANDVREIWYGLAAYEAKRLRGCDIEPRRGWFRFTGDGHRTLTDTVRLQGDSEDQRLRSLGPHRTITRGD